MFYVFIWLVCTGDLHTWCSCLNCCCPASHTPKWVYNGNLKTDQEVILCESTVWVKLHPAGSHTWLSVRSLIGLVRAAVWTGLGTTTPAGGRRRPGEPFVFCETLLPLGLTWACLLPPPSPPPPLHPSSPALTASLSPNTRSEFLKSFHPSAIFSWLKESR